ncbi:hypothetical protein HPS8415995_1583 [Glaesserella parasuis 84-15995]|nr:hypothetical protein HPS8415995_1583 [Glaesserella parasuis 84-15995]
MPVFGKNSVRNQPPLAQQFAKIIPIPNTKPPNTVANRGIGVFGMVISPNSLKLKIRWIEWTPQLTMR